MIVQGDSCGVPPWWPWPCASVVVVRRRRVAGVVPVRRVRVVPVRAAAWPTAWSLTAPCEGACESRPNACAAPSSAWTECESADAFAATAEWGSTLCSSWCPASPRYSPVNVM